MQFHWTYKMGQVKELNIKNQTYYFFDNMINIKNFHSDLLKIDKKSYKVINIYYIGYITIKNFSDCENIGSVNPFYLIIHSATGHLKEKNGEKYLIIYSTEKYEEVFFGIKSEIKTINGGKKLFYEENYARIGVNTDDDLPLKQNTKISNVNNNYQMCFSRGWKIISTNLFRWMFIWVRINARIR